MSRETVFIGFGSNQGDRRDLCDRAVTLLSLLPHSQMTGVSSLYEAEPIVDSRSDPGSQWFLNGVVRLETELAPHSLLDVCREIESALGRDHEHRGGARTMDLDVLFYGAQIIDHGGVTVPHPRLHLRRFVLTPLAELDPGWTHPTLGQTTTALLAAVRDSSVVRRIESAGLRYGSRPTCTSTQHNT